MTRNGMHMDFPSAMWSQGFWGIFSVSVYIVEHQI
jgi:hypothetical protein